MKVTDFSYQWQALDCYQGEAIPETRLKDLQDRGSLTQRLINASQGDFRVNVLSQGWQLPSLSEKACLNLAEGEEAIIREVELLCQGQVWVIARSVIPKLSLSGEYAFLADLGDRPLGEVLFKDPSLKRTSFEICEIKAPLSWGRRSVFTLGGNPILVAEIFQEACPSLSVQKPSNSFPFVCND